MDALQCMFLRLYVAHVGTFDALDPLCPSWFLVSFCLLVAMDDDSPPRHQEKRSKHNQDHTAAPKPSGHTKVAYPHDGVIGSCARVKGARGRGGP